MEVTKTTILLPESLRRRLKRVAADRGTTVTALVTEGSQLVLDRYGAQADRDELRRRASEARVRLRRGLYQGAPASHRIDELIYGRSAGRTRGRRR